MPPNSFLSFVLLPWHCHYITACLIFHGLYITPPLRIGTSKCCVSSALRDVKQVKYKSPSSFLVSYKCCVIWCSWWCWRRITGKSLLWKLSCNLKPCAPCRDPRETMESDRFVVFFFSPWSLSIVDQNHISWGAADLGQYQHASRLITYSASCFPSFHPQAVLRTWGLSYLDLMCDTKQWNGLAQYSFCIK